MESKIESVILDGLNYVVFVTNMETLLKSNLLWYYKEVFILYLSGDQEKIIIDKKKDEDVEVITTYITQEI